MPTDEERREVAARLREWVATPWYERPWSRDAMQSLGKMVGAVPVEDIIERIASLIDRPTTTRHGKFRTKYGRETPCCEVCGYSIGDMRWNYCPKCGARILEVAE